MRAGSFAQACFYSQQSGEKAIKALWYLIDADPWGHSIQKLIAEFPEKTSLPKWEVWIERGALLDKFYTLRATRYPNGLPDLTPGQVYTREDAQRGLAAARALVAPCQEWIGERG